MRRLCMANSSFRSSLQLPFREREFHGLSSVVAFGKPWLGLLDLSLGRHLAYGQWSRWLTSLLHMKTANENIVIFPVDEY